jgi:5'-nucleotidase / UDP-sugar diphosphatase
VGGALLEIDPDGSAGPAVPRAFATLKGLTARQLQPGRDVVGSPAFAQ